MNLDKVGIHTTITTTTLEIILITTPEGITQVAHIIATVAAAQVSVVVAMGKVVIGSIPVHIQDTIAESLRIALFVAAVVNAKYAMVRDRFIKKQKGLRSPFCFFYHTRFYKYNKNRYLRTAKPQFTLL